MSIALAALDSGRLGIAAAATGLAQRALEVATAYAAEREQFGRPIASNQGLAFLLADMAAAVGTARATYVHAARLKDAGKRSDVESGMAKTLASEYCAEVTTQSFRIHGGYGYSKEYEIERLYRDAPLLLIGEGTSEIQRMVIGKKLLQRNKI